MNRPPESGAVPGKPDSPTTVDSQAAILNAIPAHIALLDSHGVIRAVNESWKRFAQANVLQNPGFGLGFNYLEVCEQATGDCADEALEVGRGLRRVLKGEIREFCFEYPCHSQTEQRWFRLMATPLEVSGAGGAVVMHINITERRLAEEALRKSEREQRHLAQQLEQEKSRLVAAQAVAKVGSWETDLASETVLWSAETHRIFGTDPATFAATHAAFLERVHPDDRALVDEAFRQSFASPKTQVVEHRLLLPDGSIKFIEERWQVVRDEADRPLRAMGTCQDITVRKHAEQRFADAQRFNLTLIETSPLAIIAYRASGEGVAANAASMRMLGAPSVDAVRRQNFREITAWQESGLLRAADEALASGQPQEHEIHVRNSFGKEIWLHCRLIPVNYEGEDYLLGFFDDIQERKRAEVERDRLFTLSLDLLCVAGFDGRLQQVNPAWTECLGWTAEELTSRPMLEFVHPDDHAATLRSRAEIQRGRSARGFENRYRCKDGSYRWLSWSVHPLAELRQVFGVARDVTERRKIEEDLGRNEALLRMATRAGRLGAWQVELPTRAITWSEEVRAIHETAPGFAPTVEDGLNFYAPEFQERVRQVFGTCSERGDPFDEELQIISAKGKRVWVRVLGEAVRDGAGVIVRVQGAFQDISHQKETELEIRRAADRLETTLESITDAFLTLDREWRFTYLNREAERLMRRSKAELLGRSIWTEFPGAAGSTFQREYERALRDNVTVGFQEFFPPLDLWVDVRAFPSAEGLAVYFRDVTESRRVEERVAEQAALLDNAHDAIIVRDAGHRITYWNKAAERIYGWTALEAEGRHLQELLRIDALQFAQAQRSTDATGGWNGEIQKTAKNGTVLTVEGSWTQVRDSQGAPRSILTIDTDITARKKLEQQFLRAQRMESIGTLAGGIAHDLNNLLAPITMGVDLLKLFAPDPRSLPVIENIERSAKRGAELVKQVLSFARGVEGARVVLQLRHVVNEVELITANTFPKNIAVVSRIPLDLAPVLADPTQINQVILNLAVNARDAMPDGGRLELSASNVVIDEQYASMNPERLVAGHYVVLQVTDNGSGMPKEVIERIFEPFYTTKEMGKGTGLGLSTVLGIVRSHGGFVNVYSEVGRGSTFKVYLPAHEAGDAPAADRPVSVPLPRGNGELILVVDDESSILDITKQTLLAFGYRVLTAEDGAQAISLYALQRDEVALVITDMMMPVMDGTALIRAMQRINPKVRVIAASGLKGNQDLARATSAGVKHFLPKPYSADMLLQLIDLVLHKDGSRPPM
jgi:two-component system cell cycle sensor histidine kinase/response regulator CckA